MVTEWDLRVSPTELELYLWTWNCLQETQLSEKEKPEHAAWGREEETGELYLSPSTPAFSTVWVGRLSELTSAYSTSPWAGRFNTKIEQKI